MRAPWSLAAVLVTALVLLGTRLSYSELGGWSPMKVTTWDAFGYYQYLPATFLYDDIGRQAWVEHVDSSYHVLGGGLYQLTELPSGNRATKYFCGTALLQLPFFALGHALAGITGHPQDGFSPPYQWCIAFSVLVYVIAALFLWRAVLLRFFGDRTVALTVVLVVLATNAIQYISVDGAQTHGYLFALYGLMLWATMRWHEAPHWRWAALLGATLGLAMEVRPTELVMLFLPLLWNTGTAEAAHLKWASLRAHRSHLVVAVVTAFLVFLPQLIYWKIVTGRWVYDVGSKWDFVAPHWRVLVGGEKGWFIYTPITLFLVAGLFFMKGRPWRRSVLTYFMLNTWIVIAWSDWHYGGSYSARALVQGYPVLALPFAAVVERLLNTPWRWPVLVLFAYLLVVNLFQIKQYNDGVIHYDRMNFAAYRAVYLKAHATDADQALLSPPRH